MWTYNYSTELYHYGIPGMKWGHRKANKNSVFKKHREYKNYAKEQDRLNKKMWNDTKNKVKSGEIDKSSKAYIQERNRYKSYNRVKSSYKNAYRMSKAARGKIMKQNQISAKTPISKLHPRIVATNNTTAFIKQAEKTAVASFIGGYAARKLINVGVKYLNNRLNSAYGIPKYSKSKYGKYDPYNNVINIDPKHYKVRTIS